MPQISPVSVKTREDLRSAVLSTLAFFALYELPLTTVRITELLGVRATPEEVTEALTELVSENSIFQAGNLYSLKPWKASDYRDKQIEISKKWRKIDNYYSWLALLPYVRLVAVINSLALGTADADSDIDFFVITKPNRLYFVRSVIIVLFRLLGVYKTRHKIKDKFCFGFFVSNDNLNLEQLLIKPRDPYFVYWLSNMRPVVGGKQYWELMNENKWLNDKLPNFNGMDRLASAKKPNLLIRVTKIIFEIVLWIPTVIAEPILRKIHIDHTFKLAENRAVTSTTTAHASMLKLHAYDVRAQIAAAHAELLRNIS